MLLLRGTILFRCRPLLLLNQLLVELLHFGLVEAGLFTHIEWVAARDCSFSEVGQLGCGLHHSIQLPCWCSLSAHLISHAAGSTQELVHLAQELLLLKLEFFNESLHLISAGLFLHPFLLCTFLLLPQLAHFAIELAYHFSFCSPMPESFCSGRSCPSRSRRKLMNRQ
jgi:hypothetical protein